MRNESLRGRGQARWMTLLGILAVCLSCLVVASSTVHARPVEPVHTDPPTVAVEGEPWVDSIVEGDDDGSSSLVGDADAQSPLSSDGGSNVMTIVETVLKGIWLFSIGR